MHWKMEPEHNVLIASHCHTKRHVGNKCHNGFFFITSFHHHLDRYSSLVCHHHFCGARVTENFFWQLFLLFNGHYLLFLFALLLSSSVLSVAPPFSPCLSWQPVVIGFISSSHLSWRSEQTAHLIPQSWRSNNVQINREGWAESLLEWKNKKKKNGEGDKMDGMWIKGSDVSESPRHLHMVETNYVHVDGLLLVVPLSFFLFCKLWPFFDGLSLETVGTHQLSGWGLTYRAGLSGGVMSDGL